MELYKIGLDATSDTSALLNNSALYEYNRLKEILDPIDCDDYICVLNGVGNIQLPTGKKKIFIATDGFCFEKNKDIIDKCDYVLHQSEKKLDFIHQPQEFNYVPFLFTTNKSKSELQIPKVIFGGANSGRNDKIQKYILYDGRFNPDVVAFLKIYDDNGNVIFDNRINYNEFIKVLRTYKYTICFSRKQYDDLQWTTARYIESISNYVLPIIDRTYCVHSSFNELIDTDIVCYYKEMHNLITRTTEDERLERLTTLNDVVIAHKDAFKDTILRIIG